MRSFYENFYRPSNTILSIVGDVDPGCSRTAAESQYGALIGNAGRAGAGTGGAAGVRGYAVAFAIPGVGW